MLTRHAQSLRRSTAYLYDRFKSLEEAEGYELSNALSQQISALSANSYRATTRGDMRNLLKLLKDAEIADTDYHIKGSTIWMPHGVRYKRQFIEKLAAVLGEQGYDEYLFPSFISTDDFLTLCEQVYDFNNQALTISSHNTKLILKPTGESSIYPIFARWLREGKGLPLRIYQVGPFYRYKSSPHAYLRPVECSFMLEAHAAFSTESEMLKEYEIALAICKQWADILCLDALVVSRPIAFNRPVSEKTVGFDVVLPNGRTIQTAIAYLQSQIFSKAYDVAFYKNGTKKIAQQITYGITERNIYTSLFVHADELGLRLPARIAPEQVHLIMRRPTELSKATAQLLEEGLATLGVRTATYAVTPAKNIFTSAIVKGVPLQVILDDMLIKRGVVELFDRRSLTIEPIVFSHHAPKILQSTLEEGDEILRNDQMQRKMEFMHTLSATDFVRLHALNAGPKRCYKVVVHDDISCIGEVQQRGLGEYIGTDQTENLSTSEPCCGCGQPCLTFGYLTKRL